MDDRHIKAEPGLRDHSQEDANTAEPKPSYKSWKKKYRKMRLQFDTRMQQSEELHRLEQKAIRTAKRLAIHNDRLMDILLDINESPQIPFERRFDLKLGEGDDGDETDEMEASQKPSKSLSRLIDEVPHISFAGTVERFPEILEEIQPKDPELYPTSFLTASDVDKYLAEVDSHLGLKVKPAVHPTAPANNHPNTSAANFALRNPTSVYNWLRKHAPKTFLQDLEKDKEKDHDNGHGDKMEGGGKRKSGAARGKRQSAASRKEASESMDWDADATVDAQGAGSIRSKRKRDDDPGYRPKGGSSRPTKKRKSRDLGSGTHRPRKSTNG